MPMHLEGSCRCGAISFSVDEPHAIPISALLLFDLPQQGIAWFTPVSLSS